MGILNWKEFINKMTPGKWYKIKAYADSTDMAYARKNYSNLDFEYRHADHDRKSLWVRIPTRQSRIDELNKRASDLRVELIQVLNELERLKKGNS